MAVGHELRSLQVDVAGEVGEGRGEPEDTAPAAHLVRVSGQGHGQQSAVRVKASVSVRVRVKVRVS